MNDLNIPRPHHGGYRREDNLTIGHAPPLVRPPPDTTVTAGQEARHRRQRERREAKESEALANYNETPAQRIIRENAEEHASYRPLRKVRGAGRKLAKRARAGTP